MSTTALQIASFVNQLKNLSLSQKQGLDNMIAAIVSESDRVPDQSHSENNTFIDGVAFGAFLSWGIMNVEKDIGDAFLKIADALEPLGFGEELRVLAQQEIFRPRAESKDVIPDLEEAKLVVTRRLRVLDRIEKTLLHLSDEDVHAVYSEETLRQFQAEWEKSLDRLVEE